MTDDKTSAPEVVEPSLEAPAIDLANVDFSNPDNIPKEVLDMPVLMPPKRVIHSYASNFKLRLSNPFRLNLNPTRKISRSWYKGQLITSDEYSKISFEEAFADRNIIKRAK
jgi:hypothetical protein